MYDDRGIPSSSSNNNDNDGASSPHQQQRRRPESHRRRTEAMTAEFFSLIPTSVEDTGNEMKEMAEFEIDGGRTGATTSTAIDDATTVAAPLPLLGVVRKSVDSESTATSQHFVRAGKTLSSSTHSFLNHHLTAPNPNNNVQQPQERKLSAAPSNGGAELRRRSTAVHFQTPRASNTNHNNNGTTDELPTAGALTREDTFLGGTTSGSNNTDAAAMTLRKIFEDADVDDVGFLTADQTFGALKVVGVSMKLHEMHEMLDEIDINTIMEDVVAAAAAAGRSKSPSSVAISRNHKGRGGGGGRKTLQDDEGRPVTSFSAAGNDDSEFHLLLERPRDTDTAAGVADDGGLSISSEQRQQQHPFSPVATGDDDDDRFLGGAALRRAMSPRSSSLHSSTSSLNSKPLQSPRR
ncbi:Hypothetical protein, putative, partial [Bodo saltans]